MTPRTVTFSLNETMSVADAMEQLQELSSHSRVPIYAGEPNNVTGIVMRKDVLARRGTTTNGSKANLTAAGRSFCS